MRVRSPPRAVYDTGRGSNARCDSKQRPRKGYDNASSQFTYDLSIAYY